MSDKALMWQIEAFAFICDYSADDLSASAAALQNGQGGIAIRFGNDDAKADPHIVDLIHFRIADACE